MNNPELDAAFEGIPLVDLTGPDGKVYHFRYGAMIPYAGQEYAVLLELELDENGEEHEEVFSGFKAWVIQHEYDHLEGYVFTDHLSPLKKRLLKSKLTNIATGKSTCRYKCVRGAK